MQSSEYAIFNIAAKIYLPWTYKIYFNLLNWSQCPQTTRHLVQILSNIYMSVTTVLLCFKKKKKGKKIIFQRHSVRLSNTSSPGEQILTFSFPLLFTYTWLRFWTEVHITDPWNLPRHNQFSLFILLSPCS